MTFDQAFVAFYLISTLILGLFLGRGIASIRDFAVSHRNYTTTIMLAAYEGFLHKRNPIFALSAGPIAKKADKTEKSTFLKL